MRVSTSLRAMRSPCSWGESARTCSIARSSWARAVKFHDALRQADDEIPVVNFVYSALRDVAGQVGRLPLGRHGEEEGADRAMCGENSRTRRAWISARGAMATSNQRNAPVSCDNDAWR